MNDPTYPTYQAAYAYYLSQDLTKCNLVLAVVGSKLEWALFFTDGSVERFTSPIK